MPKSYYLDNLFVNAALRNVAFVPPPIVFLALYTAAPGPGGGGTELAGGGYGRQPIVFAPPSNGSSSNVSDIVFPVALTDWGTITSYGIFDAASGGNLLYFANLSAPRTILTNDQVKLPAGQLLAQES